jgi:transcriptional regulator of acetoin/glycerol metabolism
VEREENILSRGCIAAPVRDVLGRTIGAMSASLLASQLAEDRIPPLADLAREAAQRIGEGLSNRPLASGVPGMSAGYVPTHVAPGSANGKAAAGARRLV